MTSVTSSNSHSSSSIITPTQSRLSALIAICIKRKLNSGFIKCARHDSNFKRDVVYIKLQTDQKVDFKAVYALICLKNNYRATSRSALISIKFSLPKRSNFCRFLVPSTTKNPFKLQSGEERKAVKLYHPRV